MAHLVVVSWAGFSIQTTVIAITWGTKNKGAGKATAQTAKLLLVQINSKTQASQFEMCIPTYTKSLSAFTLPPEVH